MTLPLVGAGPTSGVASFVPAATRPADLGLTTESSGAVTVGMGRARHVACGVITQIKLVYSNTISGDTNGTSALTVRASVEDAGGTPNAVTFSGVRDVVIAPGAYVVSDPVTVSLADHALFFTRTSVTVAAAGKWPTNMQCIFTGDGYETGSVANDKTTSGTVTALTNGTAMYGPSAVLGAGTLRTSVALVGDSIALGVGDGFASDAVAPFQHGPYADSGWIRRGLNGQFGMVSLGKVAEQGNSSSLGTVRLALAKMCKYAVVQYGTNNFNTSGGNQNLATLQANILAVHSALGAVNSYAVTLPPLTTSSDAWATVANQTVSANDAVRIAYNTWIRDGAPISGGVAVATGTVGATRTGDPTHPMYGWFDPVVNVESVGSPGKWDVLSGTADSTNGTKNLVNVTGGPWRVNDGLTGTVGIGTNTIAAVGAGTITMGFNATATNTGVAIREIVCNDGTHPSTAQCNHMSDAINTALFT